jgi:hypothetical protein
MQKPLNSSGEIDRDELQIREYVIRNKTLSEALAYFGIEHHRDDNTANTGKRVLKKDGVVIGSFTAPEAWDWLKNQHGGS